MNRCGNCNISVSETPLFRINRLGDVGIFWCEKCIQKEEPELYNNIQEDKTDLEKNLKEIFYGKRNI